MGRPNAGKSSLFNRLVERDRAIVTATPGTTRDLVTERVSLGGIPVELIDTAGLRHSADEAESLGIAKSRETMAEADVVLLVLDATEPLHEEDEAAMAAFSSSSISHRDQQAGHRKHTPAKPPNHSTHDRNICPYWLRVCTNYVVPSSQS